MDLMCNTEIELLNEIYSIKVEQHEIVKENLRFHYLYEKYGDEAILVEGFSSTISKIGDFFKRMIEKIKEFFRKVLMFINSCFMDIDKFVKKYKKELDAISGLDLKVEGNVYTLHDAPDMTEFNKIVSEYNSVLSEIGKVDKNKIKAEQNAYLSTQHMDKLRGEILGSKQPISESDFHETVRKYYRDGEIDTVSIEIDDSKFREIINGVDELVKGRKEAEKTRDELIVLLSKTQKFFSQKINYVYDGGTKKLDTKSINTTDNKFSTSKPETSTTYTEGSVANIETVIKFKYNQVSKLATIINLVASERANAYKDQVKFTRNVIKAGLSYKKPKEDDK